jgi:hypothetical protein
MADRCEKECPRIQTAKTNVFLSGLTNADRFPAMTTPDGNADRELQSAREDAENCEGPVEEVVLVTRGLPWNRRTVQERRVRCGLCQPFPCAIPSELVEV